MTIHGRIMHGNDILRNNCLKIFSGKCYVDDMNDISILNATSNQEIITYTNTFYLCNLLVSLKQNDNLPIYNINQQDSTEDEDEDEDLSIIYQW